MTELINDYLQETRQLLPALPLGVISQVAKLLHQARLEGRHVFLMGNGGSAATASHFACDLGKGTAREDMPRFKVIALTDNVPLISAWANDTAYEEVFAQQLKSLASPGDLVIAFSGSGRSPNVLKAMERARELKAVTIGFSGMDGGKLKDLVDICIKVPSLQMEHVEDVHHMLQHLICVCLRRLAQNEPGV